MLYLQLIQWVLEGPAHIFIPQPYALAGRTNAARRFFYFERLYPTGGESRQCPGTTTGEHSEQVGRDTVGRGRPETT